MPLTFSSILKDPTIRRAYASFRDGDVSPTAWTLTEGDDPETDTDQTDTDTPCAPVAPAAPPITLRRRPIPSPPNPPCKSSRPLTREISPSVPERATPAPQTVAIAAPTDAECGLPSLRDEALSRLPVAVRPVSVWLADVPTPLRIISGFAPDVLRKCVVTSLQILRADGGARATLIVTASDTSGHAWCADLCELADEIPICALAASKSSVQTALRKLSMMQAPGVIICSAKRLRNHVEALVQALRRNPFVDSFHAVFSEVVPASQTAMNDPASALKFLADGRAKSAVLLPLEPIALQRVCVRRLAAFANDFPFCRVSSHLDIERAWCTPENLARLVSHAGNSAPMSEVSSRSPAGPSAALTSTANPPSPPANMQPVRTSPSRPAPSTHRGKENTLSKPTHRVLASKNPSVARTQIPATSPRCNISKTPPNSTPKTRVLAAAPASVTRELASTAMGSPSQKPSPPKNTVPPASSRSRPISRNPHGAGSSASRNAVLPVRALPGVTAPVVQRARPGGRASRSPAANSKRTQAGANTPKRTSPLKSRAQMRLPVSNAHRRTSPTKLHALSAAVGTRTPASDLPKRRSKFAHASARKNRVASSRGVDSTMKRVSRGSGNSGDAQLRLRDQNVVVDVDAADDPLRRLEKQTSGQSTQVQVVDSAESEQEVWLTPPSRVQSPGNASVRWETPLTNVRAVARPKGSVPGRKSRRSPIPIINLEVDDVPSVRPVRTNVVRTSLSAPEVIVLVSSDEE